MSHDAAPARGSHAEVNMEDVARQAGVSIATVSRALRGVQGVSANTRRRVLAAAEELSYVVSPAASSLSGGATGRVAVVVPKLDSWFAATMTAAIETTVRGGSRDVLLYQVDGRDQRSRFFRELPTRRKVDAVVLVSLPLEAEEEARLDLIGVEVVVAGARLRDYPFVEVDDIALARTAVRHLADLGHTRIGMIRTSDTEGAHWTSDLHRVQGYTEVLAERGLGEPILVTEAYGVHAGARGMARLLALPDPPTAVFCYSDDIAVSAYSELVRRGLRVPHDVSLIGVDGNPLAETFCLTSIDQHVGAQARCAGEMALHLLRGEPLPARGRLIDFTLVDRGSTGPASR
ncbi:LacI family DNA-binding transcriptional regulator [Nocardioides sp.]|uniref:LacI family DNA-binding transcriptional regulator n=1 Tax=Nocardioides sp. TaxID=35761 RepID=UPI0035140F3E